MVKANLAGSLLSYPRKHVSYRLSWQFPHNTVHGRGRIYSKTKRRTPSAPLASHSGQSRNHARICEPSSSSQELLIRLHPFLETLEPPDQRDPPPDCASSSSRHVPCSDTHGDYTRPFITAGHSTRIVNNGINTRTTRPGKCTRDFDPRDPRVDCHAVAILITMALFVQVDVTKALISRYRRLLTKPGLRNLVTFETLLLPRIIPNEVPQSHPIRIVVRSILRFRIAKNGSTLVNRLYGREPQVELGFICP